ncbi:MAG TPA: hypothetical protein VGM91_14880 [Conexibacter sp.]|jgi:hypothetical protein
MSDGADLMSGADGVERTPGDGADRMSGADGVERTPGDGADRMSGADGVERTACAIAAHSERNARRQCRA